MWTFKPKTRQRHLYVFAQTYSELLLGLFLGVILCEALLTWFYSHCPNPALSHGIEGSAFSPHILLGTMWSIPFMAAAILWFYMGKLEQSEPSHSLPANQHPSALPHFSPNHVLP